jgi:osmoprotectant transport system permease protein
MKMDCIAFAVFAIVSAWSVSALGSEVRIGSKHLTESIIIGEMLDQIFQAHGISSVHKKGLGGGGTQVLWKALQRGEIDVYPDYTGTLQRDLLGSKNLKTFEEVKEVLKSMGLGVTQSLGYSNSYALGIKESLAKDLHLKTISDLTQLPHLKLGFSQEFMDRPEGWKSVQKHYRLPQNQTQILEHELSYRAIDVGAIDVIDLYTTDAEIAAYHLVPLQDDLRHFPSYESVLVYRLELAQRNPEVIPLLRQFEGKITEREMVDLNLKAKIKKVPESLVAGEFVHQKFNIVPAPRVVTSLGRIWSCTQEHLFLVGIALVISIIIGIPLGVAAAKFSKIGQFILSVSSLLQTIPSLALLVLMIPFLGIGRLPAIVAIVLYSLLPIIRNTFTGLRDISPSLKESAMALGLSRGARVWSIELPLASRLILAGVKTSAVLNVGAATLGALIGAGGYGQLILTGIRLDDLRLIFEGAIPAAFLALVVQGLFEQIERAFVPKGLRSSE